MKTLEQQNAIIAEFMGQFDGWDFKMFKTGTWEFQTPEILRALIPFKSNSIKTECFSTTIFKSYEVKFHTSWDWLMTVVEKIQLLDIVHENTRAYDSVFKTWSCTFSPSYKTHNFGYIVGESKNHEFEAVYNAVCQFIEWYNANK